MQLEAAVSPEDYICHISWKSSDTSVLRVLSNGKVVAVGQGEAVITASIGEATSSVTITVTGEQPGESGLTGVSLDRYTLTLYAGEEAEQLTATLKPEGTEATIRWTSSQPDRRHRQSGRQDHAAFCGRYRRNGGSGGLPRQLHRDCPAKTRPRDRHPV